MWSMPYYGKLVILSQTDDFYVINEFDENVYVNYLFWIGGLPDGGA